MLCVFLCFFFKISLSFRNTISEYQMVNGSRSVQTVCKGYLGNFSCFCCLASFFQNVCFSKIILGLLYIKVSNSSDPDQDQHYVSPDLGPSCLQRLSADIKSHY